MLWKGDTGTPMNHLSPSYIPLVPNNRYTQLKTFATAVDAYSLCNYSFARETVCWKETEVAPGAGANIDKKGIIYFRDPRDWHVHTFTYPAPIAASIEDVGYGKRIKDATVIAIVALLSTFVEETLVPLYGVYYEKV